jgi:hypothetical protein
MLNSKIEFFYKKELKNYSLQIFQRDCHFFLTVQSINLGFNNVSIKNLDFQNFQYSIKHEKKSFLMFKKYLHHGNIFSSLYSKYPIKKLLIQYISFFIDDIINDDYKGFVLSKNISNENIVDFVCLLSLKNEEKIFIFQNISFQKNYFSLESLKKIKTIFLSSKNGSQKFQKFLYNHFENIPQNDSTISFLIPFFHKKNTSKLKIYFPYLVPYFQELSSIKIFTNYQKEYYYTFSIDSLFIHHAMNKLMNVSKNPFIVQEMLQAILSHLSPNFHNITIQLIGLEYKVSFFSLKEISIYQLQKEFKKILSIRSSDDKPFQLDSILAIYQTIKYKDLLEKTTIKKNKINSSISKI